MPERTVLFQLKRVDLTHRFSGRAKYLDCSNPKSGFARIKCTDCRAEYLLTLSCKTRGFCPSCHAKRLEEWGERVRGEVLRDVGHRQVVFTIPKMLRIFFKYKRKLLGDLCRCGVRALLTYLQATTDKELMPGIVAVIQTTGRRMNFHPHLHFLITDGGKDEEGSFQKVTVFDDRLLARLFSREVFTLLLKEKLITLNLVRKILSWRHSGFNVHSKVKAGSKEEAERIGKYMIRPPVSLERLCFDEAGKVSYRFDKHSPDREQLDYLELIARVTSHIPDKGQVMVRYYGLYANAHRGKMQKSGRDGKSITMIEEDTRRVPGKGWAQMIKKVYEIDPMICRECGGQMRVISFITEYSVVDKIINHLKLDFTAARPPPPSLVFNC
jgi:ribosomal protein S27E